ncbi:MAG: hypothetical protein IKH51_05785 [Clostridia bacterium]|nr:hypothetical protein [Clostridia bacterium]
MALTFSGGLDLQKSRKASLNRITALPTPRYITLDCSGDKNAAFKPFLAVGEHVNAYQCVGERVFGDGSVPVYSGISGTVKEIVAGADGQPSGMIIGYEEKQQKAEIKGYGGTLAELTPEKITEIVKNAAIPCRGSYGFAYKRLQAASGKLKRFILNCCESEPGLTSRSAVITDDVDAVLNGAKIIMHALDIRNCEIAVERENGPVIDLISSKIKRNSLFSIRKTKQKYPQDEEIALIYAICGVQALDADEPERTKCAVFDAETAADVYRAVVYGVPYCERVVTVESENLLCPIGAPVLDLLEFCNVHAETAVKIISGGPLRGEVLKKLDEPVRPDSSAITVIYEGDGSPIPEMTQCNLCGRCVNVCPSRIIPYKLAELSRQKKYSKCADYGISACCECGCCDYVCPAYIPIKKLIRTAKHKKTAPKRDKNETDKPV